MSKSMWCDATIGQPVKAPKSDKFSVEVLFWREGEDKPTWGYFNYDAGVWVDGYWRQIYLLDTVKYFAYIDNPYK